MRGAWPPVVAQGVVYLGLLMCVYTSHNILMTPLSWGCRCLSRSPRVAKSTTESVAHVSMCTLLVT